MVNSHLGKLGSVSHDVLICGDEHIELQRGHFLCELAGPLFLLAHIVHTAHTGQPLIELRLPVHHDGIGYNDEMGPVVVLVLHQVSQQCHDLQQQGKHHNAAMSSFPAPYKD